jgi:hypothetical protein
MTRNEWIADLYLNQRWSMTEIGKEVGVSRERIRQILVASGVEDRHNWSLRREARENSLLAAWAHILEGTRTLEGEADRLGIAPGTLRMELNKRKLRIPRAQPQHGTRHRYAYYSCRCEDCVQANRDYMRSLKQKEAPHHGTPSGYRNYACRCEPCRQAGAKYERQRRERSQT